MVNVHASLLPRWRGAAPIQWAIRAGDASTGVSIMRMEAGLDSGPVWLRRAVPIGPRDTAGDLFARLAGLGAEALLEALPRIAAVEAPEPQDESRVTLAPRIDRAMAMVDWHRPAAEVSALIRAMDPAPGAWTTLAGEPAKLYRPGPSLTIMTGAASRPGTITAVDGGLAVACRDALLPIGEIQPAGRRRLATTEWLRGASLPTDAAFG
jgi:methionyl-tRNA formyltransferase